MAELPPGRRPGHQGRQPLGRELRLTLAVVSRATGLPHGPLPWAVPGALVTTAGYSARLVGLTLAR